MVATDELREWTRNHTVNCSDNRITLVAIADRIDAEHEADVSTACRLAAGLDNDALAERGYIALPVDADGEVVRIGDVMVMASHPFGCEDKPLVVDRMELSRGMHGEVWCLALDTDRSCWTQAAVLRHYHAPTVEDVLHELLVQAVGYSDANTTVALNTISEYAAKLRLAEGVE